MKRLLFTIAVFLFIRTNDFAQSYGLTFGSHEVVQEKRTSLDLSPEDSLSFSTDFELSFDLNFLPHHEIYFGYIVRIIPMGNTGNYQNIDLIYNQRSRSFKIIAGEDFSGISFSVDSVKLYRDWNRFSLECNLRKHTMQFSLNGHPVGSSSLPVTGNCFKFLWGANDFQKFQTRDIPPMQIRDIKITEDKVLKYDWPLDETKGEWAADRVGGHMARIKNPVWVKPKYQQWVQTASFTVNGIAGVAYDPKNDKLYITAADSLGVYTFRNDQQQAEWVASHHQDLLLGHQSIYDTLSAKLYDIFIDKKQVASYLSGSNQWDIVSSYAPLTEFWHADKFISPVDTSLYFIGGYGQLRYKNLVQRYHFATRQWDTVHSSGDYFPSRYLAALGSDPGGKYAYIIGGYGSQTGDQMLDPKNYYDLFRYDVKAGSFKRVYSLRPPAYPFTFANSLVIPSNSSTYYGLVFPNDSYNSHLQLIEGSLIDPVFRLVGDTIPYRFHDVQSFADLYYSPLSNQLIAVTLFYSRDSDKDKTTRVGIYTLHFPPEPVDRARSSLPAHGSRSLLLVCCLGLFALCVVFLVIRVVKRRRTASRSIIPLNTRTETVTPSEAGASTGSSPGSGTRFLFPDTTVPLPASTIYLFGPFQAFDKEGHDITRQFTPLLKELFLIITTYTIRNGRGISSEGLNEILWHDKADKDAKNNRSVNLAKLKPILEKIGGCVISKESGYWQLADQDIYIDYRKFMVLSQGPADLLPAQAAPDYIHQLVDIIKRGSFLSQTEYNWLDDIKSEVSNAVIDRCLSYIHHQDIAINPEFIVEIANCIFYFDQLNEDALTFKCKSLILLKRHTLASNTYQKFIKDYKDIYSADFSKTFQEIIA